MGNGKLRRRARMLRLSIGNDVRVLRQQRQAWGQAVLRQALTPAGLARAFLAGFLFQQFRPLLGRLGLSLLTLVPMAKKALGSWAVLRKALD